MNVYAKTHTHTHCPRVQRKQPKFMTAMAAATVYGCTMEEVIQNDSEQTHTHTRRARQHTTKSQNFSFVSVLLCIEKKADCR